MTEAPPPATRGLVDPDLVEAARILRGALVRVHPSFRFEERLATQLEAAAALAHAWAGGDPGSTVARDPIAFPRLVAEALNADPFESDLGPVLLPARARPIRKWRTPSLRVGLAVRVPRGAVIGGAIASGVSLAGAAILAHRWRRRPSRSPFARAARAAHRSRDGRAGGIA